MIKFIHNIGDYFSSNYFDEDFIKKVLDKTGYAAEDIKQLQKNISALKDKYFRYKQTILEGRLRIKDKVTETHQFHTIVLNALGYNGNNPEYKELYLVDEKSALPVRNILYRGNQPHLMIMEMQSLIKEGDEEPDGLFEQRYNVEEEESQTPPQKYHRSQWENVFKVPDGVSISPMVINKAVSQLFLLDAHRRPKFILLCAGNVYYILEQEKWFRGSYLEFDLESLFDEASIKRDYYGLFYFLLAKETLAPKSEIVLMEQLDEDSHKSAYEVTQDLKEGVIHAVEAIANEAVYYLSTNNQGLITNLNAETLKNECLNYVYRLLFLFYAESRDDLDILPADDAIYQHGYSLEMLRDLEQVPLNTASSQNGFFFHDSLNRLFELLSSGYREQDKSNRSFKIRHLDSPMFDDKQLEILPNVRLRNVIWQDVICQLSLSKKQNKKARGRISYANLGINQLGSVYESLLAFRGFFAETDYIEVHRKRKAKETSKKIVNTDGSYLVPRHRRDDFDALEVYTDSKTDEERIIPKGTFIYRLSGRDRQKSASYYTPEVLTQCTVKYTLKPILEKLDKGEMKAHELLELKILEPAMGAAAFHNEVINQLAEAYLQYRQVELKTKVAPDKYREETQKVKAYIALNNVYGVDLNPTAIELGKLSLWLNVIHKDMQTPFFGYRLGTGNAVVGSWLKAYDVKDINVEYPKTGTPAQRKKPIKKEWWSKAPKHLKFHKTNNQLLRTNDLIYHFLLPDKGMLPSANIRLLRDDIRNNIEESTENAVQAEKQIAAFDKIVSEWRNQFCQPLSGDEIQTLQKICSKIDTLIEDHYQHQKRINALTAGKVALFGEPAPELGMESYEEKERLAAERLNYNAPYFKLKMVMDYWCALWFWDVRQAEHLPTRQEWHNDIWYILNYGEAPNPQLPLTNDSSNNQSLITNNSTNYQLPITNNLARPDTITKKIADNAQKTTLYENERLKLVRTYAQTYRFFHYQLEFIEVFKERGGFDVAVGNPPWLKITFEEKGLMSETFPELEIRKVSAPQVRKLQSDFLEIEIQKDGYFSEFIEIESSSTFMNAFQNYPLLKGQQTNLYKCVLENGFNWISEKGYLGLIHPESVYDDPKGQPLRKEIYKRLKYHFQFQNAYNLFAEVAHREKYGSHIYSGKSKEADFQSINNLFQPSTIDGCFIHPGNEACAGIKRKDDATNSFIWNIKPHKSRLVHFTKNELKILAQTFEGSDRWEDAKLVSVHAQEIMSVLEKIGKFSTSVNNFECKATEGWHESNAQINGILERKTTKVEIDNYQFIYSGPHFYVGQPFYKTPRTICEEKGDYDIIVSTNIEDDFLPLTNFIPSEDIDTFKSRILGFNDEPYFDSFKLIWSRMVNLAGERSFQTTIALPKTGHVNTINSVIFKEESSLIELAGISSSTLYDFFIKSIGKGDFRASNLNSLPLGIEQKFIPQLFVRTLQLNCLNKYYAPLWERNWQDEYINDSWSRSDNRLKPFSSLTPEWKWEIPLRNWYERRLALVEIDVITAMALGLTLDELILIYNVQFPVLQQNEDDTWYDTKGNIVFTCSKGLTGVGVDRPVWNTIKDLKAGEIYEHTIEKSELYHGKKVSYHAPFDKCDRVEDYKVAWEHFEKIFNK
ncbi:Eco57I restriction-modification methylase domain-containing protein [Saccharicrinis sp. GN24d3]|uniref:Eco57I restriction-modification methylase domain-containing protein n=1 Tax=Saccharicrinis sp. GN24d3 TaxID=3458416 RepID=UPI0040363101